MALLSVQQASADALAAWLTAQLTGRCTVIGHWPEAEFSLLNRTLSILPIGKRSDDWHDPVIIATGPVVSGKVTSTWRIANSAQSWQLDIWCSNPSDREDVCAQLDSVLHAGASPLAQLYPAYPQQDPVDIDLLVPLATGGWSGTASFLFDGTAYDDTPDAVQRREYRATIRGTGWTALTIVATTSAMQNIYAKLRTGSFGGLAAANVPATTNTVGAPAANAYGAAKQADTPPGANPTYTGL